MTTGGDARSITRISGRLPLWPLPASVRVSSTWTVSGAARQRAAASRSAAPSAWLNVSSMVLLFFSNAASPPFP